MLTVWRKLHVETDTMVRPTFAQNTFQMDWNEPRQGGVSSQVVLDVNDPPPDGSTTDEQQFKFGYIEIQDELGTAIVTARIIDYTTHEGLTIYDDTVMVNIPDCGNGLSGIACLTGATYGIATLSDDDLSEQITFTTGVWGCDDLYGTPAGLGSPDLSMMVARYQAAYILPVQDADASAVGGLATFLRNVDFSDNNGRLLWDQALSPTRNLPVSTSGFWTTLVVSAWQAEEAEDADPDAEDQTGNGVTKGIGTHKAFLGNTPTTGFASAYTGMCAVFKAVFGETSFVDFERYTVVHEVGHTFGLDHSDLGAMCARGDCQREPFTAISLRKLRDYVSP